jgi:malonyl-CoA/methylmalonyl-CoA synthetase
VIREYWERPDATAEAFTGDGWFRTGDLGALDGDGYLRIAGRSKELIITGGFNVYPREVEERLLEHPSVREAAVVGRPNDEWGEEVTAVLVTDGAIEPEALRAHAASGLAPYKVPRRYEFVDALPRNALGKVLRGEL